VRAEAERAASLATGAPPADDEPDPSLTAPPPVSDPERAARFDAVGDLLLAAVALARELRVDPELALRAAADRFRHEMEDA